MVLGIELGFQHAKYVLQHFGLLPYNPLIEIFKSLLCQTFVLMESLFLTF